MSDPLGFFAADGSSSDSEEDDAVTNQNNEKPSDEAPDGAQDGEDKLPSPNTLFRSIGRPSFLDNPQEKFIDWDRFVKTSEPEEPNIHESDSYAAIPPPSSLNSTSSGGSRLTRSILGSGVVEISAPPVQYSNSKTTSSAEQVGNKQPLPQESKPELGPENRESGEAPSAKRIKTDHFRMKEKRKRDLGQSSRGKSYVEEEKRILRQQFKSDEILS